MVASANIRLAVRHPRAHRMRELAEITLFSDGITVYQCRGRDEIVVLLSAGQGVFAIALGGAMPEIAGAIPVFATERESLTATLIGLSSGREGAPTSIRAAG